MNAGAYGGQVSDILLCAECLTASGEFVTLRAEELDFGYRRSALQENGAVLLRAVFGLRRGEREKIEETMRAHMQARRDKQPLEYPSCGSVFKRPEGHFAGALIEQCGLKGTRVGGAEVSEKHAGFIVNRGNATASDILALIRRVSDTVFERTGVRLEPEIRIVE